MSGETTERAWPTWRDDCLDSPVPPTHAAPYYDDVLRAWVLTRYEDVLAAFRSPALLISSPNSTKTTEPEDEVVHAAMRAETTEALPPEKLRAWAAKLTPVAEELVGGLPVDRPVDLATELAQPYCLHVTAVVLGLNLEEADKLRAMALPVAEASKEPYDLTLRAAATTANDLLRPHFSNGPVPLRDPGLVALAYTLPALLANSWFALLQHPQEWAGLHRDPGLMPQAVEEMLRYAGLARSVYRRAARELEIGDARIGAGERVILRITAANRDPERFERPNSVEIGCPHARHLALGAGAYSCVGASLIRMAMSTVTRAMVGRFAKAEPAGAAEWRGGSNYRMPERLPVRLSVKSAG